MIDKKKVIVATMCFARTEEEGERILNTFKNLRAHGYDVVAADRGSPSWFIEKARATGVTLVNSQAKNAAEQMLDAMQAGYETKRPVVVYMEADKASLPPHLEKTIKPIALY